MKHATFVLVQFLILAIACVSIPAITNLSPTATPIPAAAQPSPLTISEIAAQARSYTVRIQTRDRLGNRVSGTGIVIDNQGQVLTNLHVVQDAVSIEIAAGGRPATGAGRLVGVSTCDDLAVLQMTGLKTGIAILGDSNKLMPGDDVIAVGFPLGVEDSSVSRGIVSRLHVSIEPLQDLIQTDASVNPGNSGGPLINRDGQVVGIITAKTLYDRNGDPVAGMAYAISSNRANLAVAELGQGRNLICQTAQDAKGVPTPIDTPKPVNPWDAIFPETTQSPPQDGAPSNPWDAIFPGEQVAAPATPRPSATPLPTIPAGMGGLNVVNYYGREATFTINGERHVLPANGKATIYLPPGKYPWSSDSPGLGRAGGEVNIVEGQYFTQSFADRP